MGFKYQFITLAGFHANSFSMFDLARNYKQTGMLAYSELQQKEFSSEKYDKVFYYLKTIYAKIISSFDIRHALTRHIKSLKVRPKHAIYLKESEGNNVIAFRSSIKTRYKLEKNH